MMQSYFRMQSAGILLLALAGCANLSGIEPGATMLVPHSLVAGSQPDTAIFPQQHWLQTQEPDTWSQCPSICKIDTTLQH